jgi:hypothetical protein
MELVGTSALLMHNVRLVDPDDDIVIEIKKITSKKSKQTQDDRARVSELEWFGCLYTAMDENDVETIVYPTAAVKQSIVEISKIRRLGTTMLRALSLDGLSVPLDYPGPADPRELYKLKSFRHRAAVGIGQVKTMRVRPQFTKWALSLRGTLLTEVLDFDTLVDMAELAGQAQGVGDYRTGGYGRFTAKVTAVEGV